MTLLGRTVQIRPTPATPTTSATVSTRARPAIPVAPTPRARSGTPTSSLVAPASASGRTTPASTACPAAPGRTSTSPSRSTGRRSTSRSRRPTPSCSARRTVAPPQPLVRYASPVMRTCRGHDLRLLSGKSQMRRAPSTPEQPHERGCPKDGGHDDHDVPRPTATRVRRARPGPRSPRPRPGARRRTRPWHRDVVGALTWASVLVVVALWVADGQLQDLGGWASG